MIKYRAGYKYQLHADYSIQTDIIPVSEVNEAFIKLSLSGELTVLQGYAWDGVSGIAIDTRNSMRASLVHDALYQLMRFEQVSAAQYKDQADRLFEKICVDDGVTSFVARVYYLVLKYLGEPGTKPTAKREVREAP